MLLFWNSIKPTLANKYFKQISHLEWYGSIGNQITSKSCQRINADQLNKFFCSVKTPIMSSMMKLITHMKICILVVIAFLIDAFLFLLFEIVYVRFTCNGNKSCSVDFIFDKVASLQNCLPQKVFLENYHIHFLLVRIFFLLWIRPRMSFKRGI